MDSLQLRDATILMRECLEMDKLSGVIYFPLCSGEEDPLPPLNSLHPSISVSVLTSGKWQEWEEVRTPPRVCMLKNFKGGIHGDSKVKLTPVSLGPSVKQTGLRHSRPVGWPWEGSLDKVIVNRGFEVVVGEPRHPDQFLLTAGRMQSSGGPHG
jgi:hypothetical protein